MASFDTQVTASSKRRMSRRSRRLFLVVWAAVSVLGAWRRRPLLAGVAPELRTPAVWFPASISGPLTLGIGRRILPFAPRAPLVDGVTVRDEHIPASGTRPDLRVVVYEPRHRDRPSGALLWIHGGGLVMGRPEQVEGLCSRVAAEHGIVVASVAYRLAPEHRFPVPVDDCFAALEWLHGRAVELGIDPARVAIGGDSAGGGLAAAVAQMAVDRGGPSICFQALQYPMLDHRTPRRRGADGLVWTARSNRWAWEAYLGHSLSQPEARPYASASLRADLSGLPPAWIGIGDIDLFHDECVDYAERLVAAGVPCDLHIEPGMYHGAETLAPTADSMRRFVDRLVAAVGEAVTPDTVDTAARTGA